MEIKLSTDRKLILKPMTRDDKDDIADNIEYNHVEDSKGNWQKVDMKAPQKMITKWLRQFVIGGDFKKFTTKPNGQISDECIDELDITERHDFFADILKLAFGGNESPSDSNSTS